MYLSKVVLFIIRSCPFSVPAKFSPKGKGGKYALSLKTYIIQQANIFINLKKLYKNSCYTKKVVASP
jgi:hypothetical protein